MNAPTNAKIHVSASELKRRDVVIFPSGFARVVHTVAVDTAKGTVHVTATDNSDCVFNVLDEVALVTRYVVASATTHNGAVTVVSLDDGTFIAEFAKACDAWNLVDILGAADHQQYGDAV
uniref:Uncharacterized protein n=1 Tax=Pseudomonas phage Cygsa01 TaxID=3138529 RepID=A0AAU6W3J5_9VIRU